MIDYLALYDKMRDNNIMLTFKGEVSFELINSVLKIMEERLDLVETSKKTRKKVYNVLVECLQNVCNHLETGEYSTENNLNKNALLIIESDKDNYHVVTGNHVAKSKVDMLKARIDEVNASDKEHLRDLYKKILDNGVFSEKGGGGLGFIDIARKSGQKLIYHFTNVDQEVVFFTLQIDIPRTEND